MSVVDNDTNTEIIDEIGPGAVETVETVDALEAVTGVEDVETDAAPATEADDDQTDDDQTDTADDEAEGLDEDLDELDGTEVADLAEEGVPFAELGLPRALVELLAENGVETAFPVQAATIPDALAGRHVLGKARTGSGKTLAFGLPMLANLAGKRARKSRPLGLILVPTRELAMQVSDALRPYGYAVGVDIAAVFGGAPMYKQVFALRRGVEVLVATPGRLTDLIEQEECDLSEVQIAVLDEADQMADMGFLPGVSELLGQTDQSGQRLLFSATLDGAVDELVQKFMTDPVLHSVASDEGEPIRMDHHLLVVEPHDKAMVTAEIAARHTPGSGDPKRTILFARTKLGADRIAGKIREEGVQALALHGGMTQAARTKTLADFKTGRVPVLVATDVAARGIHVDGIDLVLHVDPANDPKDYLHRAGRTARAGEAGTVVTLVLPKQRKATLRLLEQAGVEAELTRVAPSSEELRELTGGRPVAEYVAEADAFHAARRAARDAERNERGGRGGFDRDRGSRGGFGGDRGGRGGFDRGDRDSRGGFGGDRGGRGGFDRGDRDSRGGFGDRDNRGGRSFDDRGPRGGFDRDNRGGGRSFDGDRGPRGGFGDRDNRGGFGDRDNRGGRSFEDRGPRGGFGGDRDSRGANRGERSFGDRPAHNRGGFGGDRDTRGGTRSFGDDRGNRGGFGDRDNRGGRSFEDRGPRGGFGGDRDTRGANRGGFDRDNRGERSFGDRPAHNRGGFGGDRDTRGGNRPFGDDRGNRGGYGDRNSAGAPRGFGDRDNRGGPRGGFDRNDRGGNPRGGYGDRPARSFDGPRGEGGNSWREPRDRRSFDDRGGNNRGSYGDRRPTGNGAAGDREDRGGSTFSRNGGERRGFGGGKRW